MVNFGGGCRFDAGEFVDQMRDNRLAAVSGRGKLTGTAGEQSDEPVFGPAGGAPEVGHVGPYDGPEGNVQVRMRVVHEGRILRDDGCRMQPSPRAPAQGIFRASPPGGRTSARPHAS